MPYHSIIFLPDDYEVYDFSKGYDPNRTLSSAFGIGKYNEHRPTMYNAPQFTVEKRSVHMGIDIGAPVGTPVYAFADGSIFKQGYNALPFDYGATIVTKNQLLTGETIYVLHGHLSRLSLTLHQEDHSFKKGDIIGYIGNKTENGGWNPHLHVQLSRKAPQTYDLPGVVCLSDREEAMRLYPDPQIILGTLY